MKRIINHTMDINWLKIERSTTLMSGAIGGWTSIRLASGFESGYDQTNLYENSEDAKECERSEFG